MHPSDDQDLRARFAALRDEDAAGTPPLGVMLARAQRGRAARRPVVRWLPAIGVSAAGIVLAVALLRPGNRERSLVSLEAARWHSPTDFLLRVPGAEYFESVPSLGGREAVLVDSLR